MGATGYEVRMYQDIHRIANALEQLVLEVRGIGLAVEDRTTDEEEEVVNDGRPEQP